MTLWLSYPPPGGVYTYVDDSVMVARGCLLYDTLFAVVQEKRQRQRQRKKPMRELPAAQNDTVKWKGPAGGAGPFWLHSYYFHYTGLGRTGMT